MNRHILTAIAGLVLIVVLATTMNENAPTTSEGAPVTGDALTALLAGKTAIGDWNEDQYRQYFGPSGTTYYAPKGKRSTRGKWRVSESGTHYESRWNGADDNWEAYGVVQIAGTYAWVDPDGKQYPFEVVDGQQLVWPE